jgi:hypothetical protein
MRIDELVSAWAEGLATDFGSLEKFFAPEAEIWHSTDNAWITQEESRRRSERLEQSGRPLFSEIRTQPTAKGFLVQASLEPADGRVTHLVQVVTVVDGRVTHVEEYIAPEQRRS